MTNFHTIKELDNIKNTNTLIHQLLHIIVSKENYIIKEVKLVT